MKGYYFKRSITLILIILLLNTFDNVLAFAPIRRCIRHNHNEFSCQVTSDIVQSPMIKLYLGNLPFSVKEEDLLQFVMTKVGPDVVKSVNVPRGKKSKSGLGFAFVDLLKSSDMEVATTLAVKLNGTDFNGRKLNSNVKVIKEEPLPIKSKAFTPNPRNTIYLANLDETFNERVIIEMCEDLVGPNLVLNVKVPLDVKTKEPRGFAYIEFVSAATVPLAIEQLHNLSVGDKLLSCLPYQPPGKHITIPAGDFSVMEDEDPYWDPVE